MMKMGGGIWRLAGLATLKNSVRLDVAHDSLVLSPPKLGQSWARDQPPEVC